ncbi:BrnT family toxin [Magnetospirillum sp. UT-4]|uniref:BrnT family toxin n=1 Tax=Magnetospirillum sp. UT-4 TaxID=2681467 RepID=UPI00137E2EFC|nr:BrnT family toxin [Magnetospirillum sp. UT-4]CAA7623437.1 conserved hypothetical protein [Magnetospirillum sp. UT-4]
MAAPEFEWDEAKNVSNVCKHGIGFESAATMFAGPVLVKPDRRLDYGEDRFLAIGLLDEREIAVVFTPRDGRYRLISARKAHDHERRAYRAAHPRHPEAG